MKRKALIILIIIWMIFIFVSSSQNSETSAELSGTVIETAVKVLPSSKDLNETELEALISDLQHIVRKSAHFTLYMLGAILFVLLYSTYDFKKKKIYILSFLSTVIYAISDEVHQLFISGRGPQIQDVVLDGCGAIVGILMMILIYKLLDIIKIRIMIYKSNKKMINIK